MTATGPNPETTFHTVAIVTSNNGEWAQNGSRVQSPVLSKEEAEAMVEILNSQAVQSLFNRPPFTEPQPVVIVKLHTSGYSSVDYNYGVRQPGCDNVLGYTTFECTHSGGMCDDRINLAPARIYAKVIAAYHSTTVLDHIQSEETP